MRTEKEQGWGLTGQWDGVPRGQEGTRRSYYMPLNDDGLHIPSYPHTLPRQAMYGRHCCSLVRLAKWRFQKQKKKRVDTAERQDGCLMCSQPTTIVDAPFGPAVTVPSSIPTPSSATRIYVRPERSTILPWLLSGPRDTTSEQRPVNSRLPGMIKIASPSLAQHRSCVPLLQTAGLLKLGCGFLSLCLRHLPLIQESQSHPTLSISGGCHCCWSVVGRA